MILPSRYSDHQRYMAVNRRSRAPARVCQSNGVSSVGADARRREAGGQETTVKEEEPDDAAAATEQVRAALYTTQLYLLVSLQTVLFVQS